MYVVLLVSTRRSRFSRIIPTLILTGFLLVMLSCQSSVTEPVPDTEDPEEEPTGEMAGAVFNKDNAPIPVNHFHHLEIDSEERLWAVTKSPRNYLNQFLVIYDGENWDISHLDWPPIAAFTLDHDDTAWFGADPVDGPAYLISFDGSEWKRYEFTEEPLAEEEHLDIYTIAVDRTNDIWVGTDRGLAHYDRTEWTYYQEGDSDLNNSGIYDIAVDRNNELWITTGGGSITHFDRESFTFYNFNSYGYSNHGASSVEIDSHGRKWMNPSHMGIASFTVHNMYLYDEYSAGIPDNYLSDVAVDRDDGIWSAYPGVPANDREDEAVLYMNSREEWIQYTMENSHLPHNTVWDIAADDSGNVWFGTTDGLFLLNIDQL